MRSRLIICVAVLAGCAPLGSPATTPSPSETTAIDPTPTPRPSLAPGTGRPQPGGEQVTGILGADTVEGGCTYLEADDGTRYQVIYPQGWEVRASPLQLTNPSGQVVATGGETITVLGRRADDMVSICMIGPMFVAAEVVSVD